MMPTISCASSALSAASSAASSASRHYIINMTGRDIKLDFYMDSKELGKHWISMNVFGPLALAGKSPDDFLATITATILPPAIDMHIYSCSEVTVHAFKLGSKNAVDKKIKGVKMPVPALSVAPNDFEIILDGDQLVIKRLNTVAGVPIPGTNKSNIQRWPAKPDTAAAVETVASAASPADQMAALASENGSLNAEIKKLQSEINSLSTKDDKKKIASRKKTIHNDQVQIQANNDKINMLKAQIPAGTAAAPVVSAATPVPAITAAKAVTTSTATAAPVVQDVAKTDSDDDDSDETD